MKYMLVHIRMFLFPLGLFFLFGNCTGDDKSLNLTSKDGLNTIELSLNENGELFYQVSAKIVCL